MLISLNDALKSAKDNGATENPGIDIRVHVRFEWLARIMDYLFCFEIHVSCGEIEDGKLVMKGKGIWSAK